MYNSSLYPFIAKSGSSVFRELLMDNWSTDDLSDWEKILRHKTQF